MEIKRDLYLQRIVDRMHNGMIKVITGIRRSGKSYLLFTIFKNYLISQNVPEDHIIAIELDMLENKRYRDPYVILDYIKSRITDEKDYYIFLDEVQLLEEFEEVLNSLLHIKNADIYVTGSNSKFCQKILSPSSEGVEMKYMFFRSVLRNIWMYSMVINMKDGVLMLILVGFR